MKMKLCRKFKMLFKVLKILVVVKIVLSIALSAAFVVWAIAQKQNKS